MKTIILSVLTKSIPFTPSKKFFATYIMHSLLISVVSTLCLVSHVWTKHDVSLATACICVCVYIRKEGVCASKLVSITRDTTIVIIYAK